MLNLTPSIKTKIKTFWNIISAGNFETALEWLQSDEAIRIHAGSSDNKALILAIMYGPILDTNERQKEKFIMELLKIDSVKANANNNDALFWAVENNLVEVVKILLDIQGLKPNEMLGWAIKHGQIGMVKILLDILELKPNEMLYLAIKQGHIGMVKILLQIDEMKENPAAKNNKALRLASRLGRVEVVQILLQINEVRDNAATLRNVALYEAILNGHVATALELLKIDTVKVNAAIKDNEILFLALKNNFIEVIEIMLTLPTVINSLLANNALTLIKFFHELHDPQIIDRCLHALVIYGIPMNKIIDPKSETFLQDIQSYCQAPEAYLENYSLNQKQALRILKFEQDVSGYEQALREEMQGLEVAYAGNPKKVARVMRHFHQVIKPAFIQRFENEGYTFEENLQVIELKIREELLNRMKANAIQHNGLIAFIEQNFNELAAGQNENLMAEGRDLYFNSNTEDEQLAWRAYDKWAPCIEWPNLLTPPFVNKEEKYSIAELYTNGASLIARELMCYGYLMATDEEGNEDQRQLSLGLLIGAIGETRRAQNKKDDKLPDNPSCLPGIAGRMETIMASHSLKMQKEVTELLPDILKTKIINAFTEALAKLDQEQQESLYYALVMLRHETAIDVLAGKGDFCEEPNWPKERQDFVDSLGTAYELMNYVNNELAKMDLDLKLHPQEIVYLLRLLADIGGGWIAPALTDAYQKSQMVEPIEEDIETEKFDDSSNILSFSSLGKRSQDNQENVSNDSEEEPNAKRYKY